MIVTIIYINENYNILSLDGSRTGTINTFVFPQKSFVIGLIRNTKRCNSTLLTPLEQYFCAISSNRVQLDKGDFNKPGRVLELDDSLITNNDELTSPVTPLYKELLMRFDLNGLYGDNELITHVFQDTINEPYTIERVEPTRIIFNIVFQNPILKIDKVHYHYNTRSGSELLTMDRLDDNTLQFYHAYNQKLYLFLRLYQ